MNLDELNSLFATAWSSDDKAQMFEGLVRGSNGMEAPASAPAPLKEANALGLKWRAEAEDFMRKAEEGGKKSAAARASRFGTSQPPSGISRTPFEESSNQATSYKLQAVNEQQQAEQQPAAPSPSAPESEKPLKAGSIAGNEAAGSQMPASELTSAQAQALDIYDAYPRKVGKDAAIKAIVKAIGRIGFDRLLASVQEYRSFTDRWLDDRKQFIPHPATWMNKGCYDDDRAEWRRNCKPGSNREQVKLHPTPTDHWLAATACPENDDSAQSGRGTILANDDWMKA